MKNVNVSKISKFQNKDDIKIVSVSNYPSFEMYDKKVIDFNDPKSLDRFVKSIKRKVYRCIEYKSFINLLKVKFDLNSCNYFNNYSGKISGLNIEMHHSPFTITDIILIQINKFIKDEKELNPLMIVKEIIRDHYAGIIGLIPLSPTVHELVHNQQIFIPIFNVYGDIEQFYQKYKEYMTPDQLDKLRLIIDMSLEFDGSRPKVLTKQFIYLEVDGMLLPHKVE